jgi:hypothetical protein
MRSIPIRSILLSILIVAFCAIGLAQSSRQSQRRTPPPKTEPLPSPTQVPAPPPEDQDVDTLKIETDLVTVPVIATDMNGIYAADLKKEEFNIWEDGNKQEVAFFATVNAPFHVVLMLDTSASTREKLGQIRQAAISFVEQLQENDKVKVIVFNDWIKDLNDFTSDRALLRAAINKTESGEGTKLYDAFSTALDAIRSVKGRKAIVLFSDGVDQISDRASLDSTLRGLDEEGVIVYPIRYDTRVETERMVRQQAEEMSPVLPTRDVINAPPSGTTAPTFPSDDPSPVPNTTRRTGPLGLPLPEEILRRTRDERDRRERDRYPSPDGSIPNDPSRTSDPSRRSDPRHDPGTTTTRPGRRSDDNIGAMLDLAYNTADFYLKELERKSGGRLLRADTIASLPDALGKIAAELRTQYALGYYPTNKQRDGKYRKIKVNTTRKNVVVRSKPGYLRNTEP